MPSFSGFILMSVAGIAWGVYTLAGKGSKHPLSDTTYNFVRTLPFIIVLVIVTARESSLSQEGILLAMLSGGLASGIGYTIWYMALNGLSAIQAAVVQLLVPVIAALGGVLFIDEVLSTRLALSSSMILGGILLVILGRYYCANNTAKKE
jgi:drug/metabolite transporter (DMT)-like permease